MRGDNAHAVAELQDCVRGGYHVRVASPYACDEHVVEAGAEFAQWDAHHFGGGYEDAAVVEAFVVSGVARQEFANKFLPEGAQILDAPTTAPIAALQGHVTSSYFSPTLQRSIALAVVIDGHDRMDQEVTVVIGEGKFAQARITSTVFYDPKGERQNVE